MDTIVSHSLVTTNKHVGSRRLAFARPLRMDGKIVRLF